MRVCYFGAFKPNYARNDFLRRSLELAGCSISICNVPTLWPTWRKYPNLTRRFIRAGRGCAVIVVAEFCQTVVPLAWAIGRFTGKPVIFDFVIGLHESSVVEKRRYTPGSFNARKLFWLDKTAGLLADLVLTGTTPYKEYLVSEFDLPADKVWLAPLGVNDEIFYPRAAPARKDGRIVVLYWGSFLPNHGVEVIIEAAAQLRDDPRFLFRFIGQGRDKPRMMERAARLNLRNVEFLPPIEFADLPVCIAGADIALGVFGDTLQARRAMANKVLQALAMRKPVLTGDTPATRENFEHDVHVYLSPLGDARALADSLRTLAADEGRRARLAENGYQRVRERLTPGVVGARLTGRIAGLLRES